MVPQTDPPNGPDNNRKVVRKRRGRLHALPEMPVDILLEVHQSFGSLDAFYPHVHIRNNRSFNISEPRISCICQGLPRLLGAF